MTTKPGVLAVMDELVRTDLADITQEKAAQFWQARATLERMAAALLNSNAAIALMVEGRQVNVTATMRDNQAALAAFRGEQP